MEFKINFQPPPLEPRIRHRDPILLIGSCFTENMGAKLSARGVSTLQNPHGILFNPVSVAGCLRDIVENRNYHADHLFHYNELWHSWNHHSRFSSTSQEESLLRINTSITEAHQYLGKAKWVILTLGSAFAYRHNELDIHVSNNHRAPAQWFTKELLSVEMITGLLAQELQRMKTAFPQIRVIFTISPVRHLRDGIVDNNRSKARLIESVHALCEQVDYCSYFPSYEIVIDELRDYRFYDIDFAHPNYQATEYVWEQFVNACMEAEAEPIMKEMYQLQIASQHTSSNPHTSAHQAFIQNELEKCRQIKLQYDYIDLYTIEERLKSQLI